MKNIVFIDIDTEREIKVQIGKPEEITPPTNAEEAKTMINTDITCVCEGLCALIQMADQNAYGNKEELVKASISHLNTLLIEGDKKD